MSVDLEPSWLGLPAAKFPNYRPGQAQIIVDVAADEKRFQFLCAPTGFGKSPSYISIIKLSAASRALILVGTKGLQSQLLTDFYEMGMREIKGQANYPCLAVKRGGALFDYAPPDTTCKEAPCKVDVECELKKSGCTYYDARRVASDAEIVVTNYSYWLSMARFGDPSALGKFDIIILDEGHTAKTWLADHCVVELNRAEVRKLLDLDLPPLDEGIAVWASWATEAAVRASNQYDELKKRLDGDASPKQRFIDRREFSSRKEVVKRLHQLKRLSFDLGEMAKAHSWRNSEGPSHDVRMPGLAIDWVATHTDHGAKFSPVWAHPYAEEYLFRGAPKVILCSATITTSETKYLGIEKGLWTWHEVKEGFKPSRRPIIYIPTVRVDNRMGEWERQKLIAMIDRIIEPRLEDRKGIIPSVSYLRANQIKERSRFGEHMLIHNSHNARDIISQFKRAKPPCILVSPSVVEGFDFPYDECRWIIVPKLPFADGRDPIEKARRKSDPEWPNYNTMIALVQAIGRGMRAEDDFCEIFILDSHFGWFRNKVRFMKWVVAAMKQMHEPPKPLRPFGLVA